MVSARDTYFERRCHRHWEMQDWRGRPQMINREGKSHEGLVGELRVLRAFAGQATRVGEAEER